MSEQARKRVMIPTPPAFRDLLIATARNAAVSRPTLAGGE